MTKADFEWAIAEPETVERMDQYLQENGYENDFSDGRLHHEIYLSDARRVAPEKWRTVIRHPVKKKRSSFPAYGQKQTEKIGKRELIGDKL